jgi:hypothetical protein
MATIEGDEGDIEADNNTLLGEIAKLSRKVDCIFMAQLSMPALAPGSGGHQTIILRQSLSAFDVAVLSR